MDGPLVVYPLVKRNDGTRKFCGIGEPDGERLDWQYLGPKVAIREWPGIQWGPQQARRRLPLYFSTPSAPEVGLT